MRRVYFLILAILPILVVSDGVEASSSRIVKAQQDIRAIEAAIERFKMDIGRYPTTSEGIEILISPPEGGERSGGYLLRVPLDPWGSAYQYRYLGTHNVDKFDLWTLGADGKQGGEGINGDYGNWPGSFDTINRQIRRKDMLRSIQSILFGSLVGFCAGLPVYLFGFFFDFVPVFQL